jgi:hypothetical protein
MPYEIFSRYLSEHGQPIHNISLLTDKLPNDPNILRALFTRCRAAELRAARSGKQFEVRRLSQLARQLDVLTRRSTSP